MSDGDLTIAEAAVVLGKSRRTVQRLVQTGKLPAKRVGHLMWVIRREDLDEVA